jgi:hypothetical protein
MINEKEMVVRLRSIRKPKGETAERECPGKSSPEAAA